MEISLVSLTFRNYCNSLNVFTARGKTIALAKLRKRTTCVYIYIYIYRYICIYIYICICFISKIKRTNYNKG